MGYGPSDEVAALKVAGATDVEAKKRRTELKMLSSDAAADEQSIVPSGGVLTSRRPIARRVSGVLPKRVCAFRLVAAPLVRSHQQPIYAHLESVPRGPTTLGLRKQGQRGVGCRGRCWRKAGHVSCCEPAAMSGRRSARHADARGCFAQRFL